MYKKKDSSTLPESKPFNQEEFQESVQRGAVIGATSTTATFGLIDKPLAQATKSVAERFKYQARGLKWFAQQTLNGNYAQIW